MAEIALKQATIEYQQFGPQDSAHPPVLFVHGILVDGRLWREVAEGLARRGFRCIVPTWPPACPGSPSRSRWCGASGTAASRQTWAAAWPVCSPMGS